MNKKLSTLSAGFAAAAVLAGTIAPATFAASGVNLTYDETMGAVSASVTDGKLADTVNVTITPNENYACEDISAYYIGKYTRKKMPIAPVLGEKAVTCDTPNFLVASDTNVDEIFITVDFFLENYVITTKNPEWTQGSDKELVITGNGAYTDFYAAYVDGNKLGEDNFTGSEGSTNVALKPSYLKTLATGEHTFTMQWNDGEDSASTTFNILAAKSEEETKEEITQEVTAKTVAPNTGVSSAVALFTAASALTLGGALVAKRTNKA